MSNKTAELQVNIEASKELNTPKTKTTWTLGVFKGYFGPYAIGLFNILVSMPATFSKEVAHLIAVDYMNDWARGVKLDDELSSKVGKAKAKDNTCTMKGAGMKCASQIRSNSMIVARIAQQIDELKGEHALVKREFPSDKCLPEAVQEYLKEKATKASEDYTWE